MNSIDKEKPADAILLIDARAKQYAAERANLSGYVTDFNLALEELRKKHLPAIRRAAARCADLQDNLSREIKARPELFVKPRTMTLHGIKLGMTKGKGKVVFDDVEKLVERIRAQLPKAQAEALLKITTKPILASLAQLEGTVLKKLGVRIESTGDLVFIEATDSEVDKLVSSILEEGTKPEEAAA